MLVHEILGVLWGVFEIVQHQCWSFCWSVAIMVGFKREQTKRKEAMFFLLWQSYSYLLISIINLELQKIMLILKFLLEMLANSSFVHSPSLVSKCKCSIVEICFIWILVSFGNYIALLAKKLTYLIIDSGLNTNYEVDLFPRITSDSGIYRVDCSY